MTVRWVESARGTPDDRVRSAQAAPVRAAAPAAPADRPAEAARRAADERDRR